MVLLCAGLGLFFLYEHRTVYRVEKDPSGAFTAVVSYRTFYSFIPMPIGSSSDKPGFVEIFDRNNKSMGRLPIAMLQLADIRWKKNGAFINPFHTWDFSDGSCRYTGDTDIVRCAK